MKIKHFLGIFILSLGTTGFLSCNDDDQVIEPEGTISLNMMNEKNGKVMLGESGVYLDTLNNLIGGNSLISDLGKMSNLGHVDDLKVLPYAREMAATAKHGYLIYDAETIREFPSNKRAFKIGDEYYKMYIESVIREGEGIKVKYIPVTVPNTTLPVPGTDIGNFSWNFRLQIDITNLKDIEYVIPGNEEYFNCYVQEENEGGEQMKYLYIQQSKNFEYQKTMNLYLRAGDKFSYVTFLAI